MTETDRNLPASTDPGRVPDLVPDACKPAAIAELMEDAGVAKARLSILCNALVCLAIQVSYAAHWDSRTASRTFISFRLA